MATPCIHFIGFRGDEYLSAVRVFGLPHFIHRVHDLRAYREIGPDDLVIFANKESPDVIRTPNAPDVIGGGYT